MAPTGELLNMHTIKVVLIKQSFDNGNVDELFFGMVKLPKIEVFFLS